MRTKKFEMKPDVKALLSKFDTHPRLKKGDLFLTAEIHRVVKVNWQGVKGAIDSVDVFPTCYACDPKGRECVHEKIMRINPKGGQNVVMVLKGEKI